MIVEAPDGDDVVGVLGRIDDVINVAGHRLGTKELEAACLLVPEVGEAAVVAAADNVKGSVPDVFVSLRPGIKPTDEIAKKVSDAIADEIGAIAKPRRVWLGSDMPKTRSGKIMRRVLASLVAGRDPGDVSTLANPEIVEELRKMVE